jgi:hypothetical protein
MFSFGWLVGGFVLWYGTKNIGITGFNTSTKCKATYFFVQGGMLKE